VNIHPGDLTLVALLVVLIVVVYLVAQRMRSGPPGMLSDSAIYRPTAKDYPADFDRSTGYLDEPADADGAVADADVIEGTYGEVPDDDEDDEQEVVDENASLEDVLRELIATPEKTEFVILQGVRGYVQFRRLPGELLGEAVRLDGQERFEMLRLGWQDGGSTQNYMRYWPDPVDVAAVSQLADDTLRVYGDDPDDATIETA
jgi:hypothetical protein